MPVISPAAGVKPYHLLDNVTWHTLAGAHAHHAAGGATARRFAQGFSPILGFADPKSPDFDALTGHCAIGEAFYTDGWSGPIPRGWKLDVESTMFKMVWEAAIPDRDEAPDAVRLDPMHAPQALELATLTHPGPFAIRTIELGQYFGFFDGERLVAMAGERMCALPMREISGVCTHPEFQGRGMARRLVAKLVRRQMERREIPFLHVMRDNTNARALYERMGFRNYRESVVRVVSRAG